MSVTVKSKDQGKARKEFIKRMKDLAASGDMHVAIGVIGKSADRDEKGKAKEPLTNVDIASIHEFGAIVKKTGAVIPERSFIRSTLRANKMKYKRLYDKYLKELAANRYRLFSLKKVFGLLGAKISADIKRTITKGIEPAIKDATVKARKRRFKKASSKPLVATAQLLNSITYEVRGGK